MPSILILQNLTKYFGGLAALRDVTIEVQQGEIVGLIGPNGAGKTTLFNLVTGFESATSGHILFKGEDITGSAPHRIVNMGIARTFQMIRPFKRLSVLDNVILSRLAPRARKAGIGMRDVSKEALSVLTRVGLYSRAGVWAQTLAHGELRRLEIARALATNPEVLLLDEPFSGLSYTETRDVLALLRELHAEGETLVVIEHKLRDLMKLVERVIVLHYGQVIAEGSPQEVANNPVVIEAYMGTGVALSLIHI